MRKKTNSTSHPPLDATLQTALQQLEVLFHEYQHSVPSANQKYCTTKYFAAIPYGDLTADDLSFGKPRFEARTELLDHFEWMRSAEGPLNAWPVQLSDKYFWQSEKYPALVIRRDWIEQHK